MSSPVNLGTDGLRLNGPVMNENIPVASKQYGTLKRTKSAGDGVGSGIGKFCFAVGFQGRRMMIP